MRCGIRRFAACAASIALTVACTAAGLSTTIPSDTPTPVIEAPPSATSSPTATAIATDVSPEPSLTPTVTAEAQPTRPADTAVPPTPERPASPPPPATPVLETEIEFFRASTDEADPGETVRIEWAARHATEVVLYHLMPSGQYGNYWEVELSGSMDYPIPPTARNEERFQLLALGPGGQRADRMLTVVLTCPDEWFFSDGPDECPSSPAIRADGAEQRFERGTMLWNGAEQVIYVLYSDGGYPRWSTFVDNWQEGNAVSDPDIVPPDGLYQPVRGFGLVWRASSSVRERLGWAVNQEAGYATEMQRTSRFKYNVTYIRALDGGVWELGPEGSAWRHIPR